jgi:hypothetical protein
MEPFTTALKRKRMKRSSFSKSAAIFFPSEEMPRQGPADKRHFMLAGQLWNIRKYGEDVLVG